MLLPWEVPLEEVVFEDAVFSAASRPAVVFSRTEACSAASFSRSAAFSASLARFSASEARRSASLARCSAASSWATTWATPSSWEGAASTAGEFAKASWEGGLEGGVVARGAVMMATVSIQAQTATMVAASTITCFVFNIIFGFFFFWAIIQFPRKISCESGKSTGGRRHGCGYSPATHESPAPLPLALAMGRYRIWSQPLALVAAP